MNDDRGLRPYIVECPSGVSYLIFHSSVLGSPTDYVPGKWYTRRIPASMGFKPGPPFDTAEDAERAVRAQFMNSAGQSPAPGPTTDQPPY